MQEVVDRQDGPNPSEPRIFGAGRPKERRDQGRMPIVRVDDVGPEVRGRDEAQDSLAEESEPLPVVVKLVDLRTVVQVRLVDQVDRDLSDPSDLKSGFVSRVPQPDRESCDLLVGALDRPIPWQDDPHVVAEGFQGLRQTAGPSPRPPTLARGYASADAKRIFIGISEWTDGRYLNLRLARLSPRLPPGRSDLLGHGRAFAKGFSLDVHAEGSAAHSAWSPRLRASHPSTVGPRPWSLAARGSVALRGHGRVLSPDPPAP